MHLCACIITYWQEETYTIGGGERLWNGREEREEREPKGIHQRGNGWVAERSGKGGKSSKRSTKEHNTHVACHSTPATPARERRPVHIRACHHVCVVGSYRARHLAKYRSSFYRLYLRQWHGQCQRCRTSLCLRLNGSPPHALHTSDRHCCVLRLQPLLGVETTLTGARA